MRQGQHNKQHEWMGATIHAMSRLHDAVSPRSQTYALPSFEERENLRRGKLLAFVLLLSYPLNLLLAFNALFPRRDWSAFVIIVVATAFQSLSLGVNRSGRVPFAATIYLMTLMSGTSVGLFTPHFDTPVFGLFLYPFFCTPIIASAYLRNSRSPIVYWFLSCVLIGSHIALHAPELQAWQYTKNIPLLGLWAISISTLSTLTLISHIGAKSMEEALRNADRAEELEAMNGELAAMQQELEAQYQQLEEANVRLEQLAATDGLTGLANHRAFQEELSQLTARVARDGKPLAVVLFDVDRFKQYNDNFGHPAGDEVLKTVAQILRQTVRQADFAARYGGEEFAALLYDADAETSAMIAERIRAAIAAHGFPNRAVTVSVGVSLHTPSTDGAATIQRADAALYRAKHGGRNCVFLADAEALSLPAAA